MLSLDNHWTLTVVSATLAVAFALAGLGLTGLYPGAAPLVASALLAASLACTATAFARVAFRVRKLELENEGLIEEISQEFDRVKDQVDILGEALTAPRQLTPEEAADEAPMRRVTVK